MQHNLDEYRALAAASQRKHAHVSELARLCADYAVQGYLVPPDLAERYKQARQESDAFHSQVSKISTTIRHHA